jgi:GNAT superfamily N-acetyltransferase
VRLADEPSAEVALAVADDHQRLGIGRVLLETLMVA